MARWATGPSLLQHPALLAELGQGQCLSDCGFPNPALPLLLRDIVPHLLPLLGLEGPPPSGTGPQTSSGLTELICPPRPREASASVTALRAGGFALIKRPAALSVPTMGVADF